MARRQQLANIAFRKLVVVRVGVGGISRGRGCGVGGIGRGRGVWGRGFGWSGAW